MKKAYILAYQKATNYGAVLQIYALKSVLEKKGLKVEVIDYIPNWMKVTLKNQPTLKSYVKRKVMNLTFNSFFNQLGLTKKTYYCSNDLKNDLPKVDFYFVGSDQVWNHKIMKKDTTYFLDFVPKNAKKIGYAISMGDQPLPINFLDTYLPLIEDFDFLSSRENFVSDFVKNYYPDKKIPNVVDPTLLLDAKDYESIRNKKIFNTEYIALYAAMHDENLYNYAKYLSSKTGLPIVNLGYHFSGADKQEYLLGPGNWLNRINQAKYFITNSFHGTVFSILYEKNFLVVPNKQQLGLNSRFAELLESLELQKRLIYSEEQIDNIIPTKIDFNKSFELLNIRREISLNYIKDAIS